MSINNLLFSVQNMSPAMLNVGPGKTQNYDNLAQLSGLLGNNDSSSTSSLLGSSGTDTVSLTYNKIGAKIVSDMAAITADTIKQYPELDNDYVIVIVDDGQSREARVYSRKEILDNFEDSAEDKKAIEAQLAENPLLVYNNANGLPETKKSAAYQQLAAKLNDFLSTNKKTLDVLDSAGYDPLADMLGSSTMKKIIANYALQLEQNQKQAESKEEDPDVIIDDEEEGEAEG